MKQVGARLRQLSWAAMTDGSLTYTGDLQRPGLLIGRVLRSPHPHARIRGIDISAARSMQGVHAVITAADFPKGVRYLHEGAADRAPLADGVVRFVGEEVAAVAADTDAIAAAAIAAIEVDYEGLPAPLDVAAARAAGAPTLHQRTTDEPNVAAKFRRFWGDVAAGRAASTHTVAGRFYFPTQAHVCMEPVITLAEWSERDQRVELWTSTSAPYFVVREVAHVMGLPEEQVICREIAVGGSFGAKSKVCEIEPLAAVLARKAGRPVRITLSREEEFATTKTRHAFETELRLHADADGRLRAVDGEVFVENGAFSHSGASVMSAGVKLFGNLYEPDGMDVTARLVDTARLPGGSFRGYGSTQTSFALECLMDEMAVAVGIDPFEIRRRNANRPGSTTLMGASIVTCALPDCLRAAREAIGWDVFKAQRPPGQGIGVAAGVHASGSHVGPGANRSDSAVDVFFDGRVRARFGGSDTGTGQKTILAQIVAEALGVEAGAMEVVSMDSETTPFDMGAWSSRGTHYPGNAAVKAAGLMADRLRTLAAERLGNAPVVLADGFAENDRGRIPLGDLAARAPEAAAGCLTVEASFVEPTVVMASKVDGRGNVSPSYNFAAHAAVVEVERRTGKIRVLDYVAAHDVGLAINPLLVEAQIIGGVAMGLGSALGEETLVEQGRPVNPAFIHYAMPRAADMPPIRPIIVGTPDPAGPHGAKAVGELGTNPPVAVIANAVFDAVGVRLRAAPFTPEKVLAALAEKQGRGFPTGEIWRRPGRWWIAGVRWAYGRGLLRWLHARQAPVPPALVNEVKSLECPGDLAGALAARGMVVAGNTDVSVQRRQGLVAPEALVSVSEVSEMRGVARRDDGGWRIGAAVTLADLNEALGAAIPALAECIAGIASPQIRQAATVGGNLLQAKRCWFYRNDFPCFKRRGGLAPCYAIEGDHRFYHAAIDGHRCQAVTPSDLASLFLALDATVTITGAGGARSVPMAAFYTGPGESVVRAGELLTAIDVPASVLTRRCRVEKLALWQGDFASASVALSARIDTDGLWREIRLVLGAMAPTPWRARGTERGLEGKRVDAAMLRGALDRELRATAHPLKNNAWKLEAVGGLAEIAVERMAGA